MFIKKEPAIRLVFTTVISALTFTAVPVQAQQLEEVIVTAQRREQNLQEVPVSIETFTGPELVKMGFRTMEDLTAFAPSVEMNESLHEWSVTIRGMGNDVANIAVEQSAPIFVDGVHFGRPSMIKGAFLDLERVEVLTGPQPVYFGQNATAGAFSLTTKKPSQDAWEGDLATEYGKNNRISVEGAFGGPVTETLGVRLAAQWDQTDGHLTDLFGRGKFPFRKDQAARLTAVWRPLEALTITGKAEVAKRRGEGDTTAVCQTEGPSGNIFAGAVLERGLVPAYDATHTQAEFPWCKDGFKSVGVQEGTGDYEAPPQGITNDDGRSGVIDIRAVAPSLFPDGDISAREPLDAWNFRLGADYEFNNGITMETIFGLVDYNRETFESSDESPFLMEAALRTEIFDMKSGEIRFSSPTGGMFEWSTGVYYQKEEMILDPVITVRANLAQPIRRHNPFSNSEWKSAFATFTFNFMGDKASIDLGGRYSDVSKEGGIGLQTATWIFDINPDPDGDGIVPFTAHTSTGDVVIAGTNQTIVVGGVPVNYTPVAEALINCQTGLQVGGPIGGAPDLGNLGANIALAQCGPYAGRAGFWTHEYGETDIPDAWDTRAPIALGGFRDDMGADIGPFYDTYSEDSFDPQITLRYRPTPEHSLYAKWARAFKAGGFDASDRGIPRGGLRFDRRAGLTGVNNPVAATAVGSFGPDGQKEFTYLAEHAENFELGARGELFDGGVRYGATLFHMEISDLQLETSVADIEQLAAGIPSTGRFMTNAGKQRTKGLEFDLAWAATDRLTLGAGGVIQKGVMVEFIGGCTDTESLAQNDPGGCANGIETQTIQGVTVVLPAGNIDRAGTKAPRTPDWKFIFNADYEQPVFNDYIFRLNSKAAVSDSYTQATLDFTYVVSWPVHTDLSALASIGDDDGTWDVGLYGRNFFGAKQKFYPELDTVERGLEEDDMPESSFFTYGIQFNYHFM